MTDTPIYVETMRATGIMPGAVSLSFASGTIHPEGILNIVHGTLKPGEELYIVPALGVEFEHPWVIFKED